MICNKTLKHILALLGAVSLTLLPGCRKSIGEGEESTDSGLRASIMKGGTDATNVIGDDNYTKAVVTKTDLSGLDYIVWSSDDKVIVSGADPSAAATMTIVTLGGSSNEALLSGTAPVRSARGWAYEGFYPPITYASTAAGGWKVADRTIYLPVSRAYGQNGNLGWIPMYAASNDNYLPFRCCFGVMEFTLVGTRHIKTLTLSTTSSVNLSGEFRVNSTGTAEAVSAADASLKTVKVDFGTDGIVPDFRNKSGMKVYVALPAGTYNLTAKITTAESDVSGGEDFNKTISSVTIEKGKLYYNTLDTEPMCVQLWDGGPYFATANLGAKTPGARGVYYAWGSTEKVYSGDGASSTNTVALANLSAAEQARHPQWTASSSAFNTSTLTNAPFYNSTTSTYIKYTNTNDVLLPEDDAATVNWGKHWRMFTEDEKNLIETNCDITLYTTSTYSTYGIRGILLKHKTKTSNQVFFPSYPQWYSTMQTESPNKGKLMYWCSTLNPAGATSAADFYMKAGAISWGDHTSRAAGCQIRAVRTDLP